MTSERVTRPMYRLEKELDAYGMWVDVRVPEEGGRRVIRRWEQPGNVSGAGVVCPDIWQQEQTIMLPPKGDCFSACMATILRVAIAEVPNPWDSDDWEQVFVDWLDGFGLSMLVVPLGKHDEEGQDVGISGLDIEAPKKSVLCHEVYKPARKDEEGWYEDFESKPQVERLTDAEVTNGKAIVRTLESAYRNEGQSTLWDSVKGYVMPGLTILGAVAGSQTEQGGGEDLHAVVCWNGDIVFDPSPGRSDGLGEWRDVTIFTVKDPSRLVRLEQRKKDILRGWKHLGVDVKER